MNNNKSVLQKPIIMGILNVTPDSFSDGGLHFSADDALASAQSMVMDGADILDVGAESTRPGADFISAEQEINRLKDILPRLVQNVHVPLSIDTYKAKTAEYALSSGVKIVNDVHGFRYDTDMASIVKNAHAKCILMHQKPEKNPNDDIIEDVKRVLGESVDIALAAGISSDDITLDIGIGFGKTYEQNLTLLKNQANIQEFFGLPFLIGASRKSFIGHFLQVDDPAARDSATLAVHIDAVLTGKASIVRAHNVKMHTDAFKMLSLLS